MSPVVFLRPSVDFLFFCHAFVEGLSLSGLEDGLLECELLTRRWMSHMKQGINVPI